MEALPNIYEGYYHFQYPILEKLKKLVKQTIEENEGLPQLASEQEGSSDQTDLYQTITFSSFPDREKCS
jgi:hypothetical protein